jgi:hypothetical protein
MIHKKRKRNTYNLLLKKCAGKRIFGKRRCTCEVNVKMNHKAMEWEGMDWICEG